MGCGSCSPPNILLALMNNDVEIHMLGNKSSLRNVHMKLHFQDTIVSTSILYQVGGLTWQCIQIVLGSLGHKIKCGMSLGRRQHPLPSAHHLFVITTIEVGHVRYTQDNGYLDNMECSLIRNKDIDISCGCGTRL